MAKYVAFLRAINVGGHVIKMETLAGLFNELKFKNVKTFIQSGNVIFETAGNDAAAISNKIEKKLEKSLGYEVKTILKDTAELNNIIKANPFKDYKLDKDTKNYIAFLSIKPGKEVNTILDLFNTGNDSFILNKTEIYCLVHKDEKNSSYFSILNLEKKLGIPLTTRNITTINKINSLLQ
ncbi:MAG: DUF1697 domain-containing protein [Ignavibacteriaceae bacterium]|nr:DUF1697 domain-containing protein [Ignavibacteriaceae bacterium]